MATPRDSQERERSNCCGELDCDHDPCCGTDHISEPLTDF